MASFLGNAPPTVTRLAATGQEPGPVARLLDGLEVALEAGRLGSGVGPDDALSIVLSLRPVADVPALSTDCRCTEGAADLVETLRAMFPGDTAARVAAELALDAALVQSWLDGRVAPSAQALVKMVFAFGPKFLAAIGNAPPAWVDVAHAAHELLDLDRELKALGERRRALEEKLRSSSIGAEKDAKF